MSSAAPASPPPRRPWARALAIALLAIVVLVLAVVGIAGWLLGTSGGAQFLASRAGAMLGTGTRIEGVEGRIGGLMRIRAIEIDRPDLYVRVDDVEMDTVALAALHGTLDVRRLAARNVEVRTASSGAAAKAPVIFKPPYPVVLEDGRVGTLRFGAITPGEKAATDPAAKKAAREAARAKDVVLTDLALAGWGDSRRWAIRNAAVTSEYGTAHLKGTIGNASPYRLELDADAAGSVRQRAYRVAAAVRGTLANLEASAKGEVSGAHAQARATLRPFAKQPLESLALDASSLDLASLQAGLPSTRLDVHADLAPQGGGFAGPVRIANTAPGRWDQGALPFTEASGQVAVDPAGSANVGGLQVALAGGGSASGAASVAKEGMKADLHLADVDLAALHGKLQPTKLTGTVSVSGDRAAQRFTVALEDPRFSVEGRGGYGASRLDIETATVRAGAGAVTAKGDASFAGARSFHVEGRAEHFDPSAFVKTAPGDLNFAFTAKGAMAGGVSGEARVTFSPSRYAGLATTGHVFVSGDAKRISSSDVHLAMGDARLDAHGSFGRPGDAMDIALHAPNLSTLASPFGLGVAGRLDAQARLTGTFDEPAGRISLTGANLALPSNVHLADVKLDAEAGSAAGSRIDASLTAHGIAFGKETPPPFAQSITASLQGTRAAHTLRVDAQMTRDSRLLLVLQGGLDPRAPKPAWNGRVESLALGGPGAFALVAPVPLAASAERIELGDATLRGDWGDARFQVTRWTPATLDVQGTTTGVELRTLARSLRLGNAPRSNLAVAGSWRVHAAESIDGSVEFHRLSGDVQVGNPSLALGLTQLVVRADVVGARVRASLDIAGERIGRVHGEGGAILVRTAKGWAPAPNAPVDARISAEVPDISVFAAWMGPDADAHGRIAANVNVSGTGSAPRVAGEVRASDLAMREPQTGFEIERGEIGLRLDGRSIAIDHLTAQAPWHAPEGAQKKIANAAGHAPGTLTASGSLDLDSRQGETRIHLAGLPVTQTPNRFVALSGDARLEATKEGVLAAADLKADAGWIGALESAPPSVSDDVVVVRAAAPQEKPQAGIAGGQIRVDARFDLGDALYFQGRGLDTRLAGNIRVTGAPPALRANGAVRTEGGTYNGYGQKLAIERGVLQFSGPIESPRLNVRAVRKGLPVEAGVEVLGTVAHPRVRLVSTPDVPEPEKLSWLVLGRAPSDLTTGDASLLVQAASSMLGKTPGEDIGQKLGFDEVKVGRASTNSVLGVLPESTVAGRIGAASAAESVTVGRSLTHDVHLSYEQELGAAEGTLKLAWKLTRSFELLARAGYLPGLDAVYRWTFE
jgi:translocation and assembly module TamB